MSTAIRLSCLPPRRFYPTTVSRRADFAFRVAFRRDDDDDRNGYNDFGEATVISRYGDKRRNSARLSTRDALAGVCAC